LQKIQPSDLKGVSETLLIPLHYRVEASKSPSDAFKDEVGERFHDAIAYDWRKFGDHSFQKRAMPIRTALFDVQVKAFLEQAPNGLVVNLGAGLDSRFHRLDNGAVRWVEIDLPDVIAFRRKLQEPQSERHWFIAASVLDEDWIDEVAARAAGNRVLFVAEGLFPYFTEEEHGRVFTTLAESFPEQEMLFQTFAPSLIQGLAQDPDLSRYSNLSNLSTNVEMRWGLEDSTQVSTLSPKVEFLREFPLLQGLYDQLPESIRQKASPATVLRAAKIVHVRFKR
jgi:O-methyltransferase involved in polyketide biosynthesis